MTGKTPDPKALRAMQQGIEKANKRSAGDFNGVFGSLPKEAAAVLHEMLAYVRHYLLEERRLTEAQVKKYAAQLIPASGFHSVSAQAEDEGIKVALGVLNSIVSVLRVEDETYKANGKSLSKRDAIAHLVSGSDGVRGMKVREGGGHRGSWDAGEDTQEQRIQKQQDKVNEVARQNPDWPFRRVANHVSQLLGVSERTIRRNTRKPNSN
jgi:hypothetical protein